jgi:hypothetical protein
MRSLSSALGNRHDREDAARHRPVGDGRHDGRDRHHPGRRRSGHADAGQAPACSSDPAGARRHRGGHHVRPGGPGGVRHRADRGSRKAPARERPDRSSARSRPPRFRDGLPQARPGTGAWPGPAPGRHPARRRSRPTRRRSAFRAAVRAEPDERLHAGRAHRRAQGWPWTRKAGRRGHPRDPAPRRDRPRSGRADLRSSGRVSPGSSSRAGRGSCGRRVEPDPAVLRPGRTSAIASWLPAGHDPGRSRSGAVRPERPAGAPSAAA